MGTKRQRGVTLVEAAATLCICGISATIAVGTLSTTLVKQRLAGVSAELATDLRYARSEAVARGQQVRIAFFTSEPASCYVIHTGPKGSCSCNSVGVTTCSADAQQLKTQHMAHDRRVRLIDRSIDNSIGFNPTNGTVTPTLTVNAIADDGRTISTIVNIMGRVKHCTPRNENERVSGYPICLT